MGYTEVYIIEAVILIIASMTLKFLFSTKKEKKEPKKIFFKSVIERNYKKEKRIKRDFLLDKHSKKRAEYSKYDDILVAFGLKAKGATVTGLKFGLRIVYILVTSAVCIGLKINLILCPLVYLVMGKLIFTFIKMRASKYKDRRERAIMDAIDIIISDISAGVTIAIRNYIDVFDKSIRDDFVNFLNNIDKNMPFIDAMKVLSDSLGNTFKDFSERAITYEIAEKEGTEEIFSETIEINSIKRDLKFKQDSKFNEFKVTFNISLCIVGGFFTLTMLSQPFVRYIYFETFVGKILFLIDALIITFVYAYLDITKSKEL